jgi:ATP-binding cassette subfamily E protein 1
MVFSGRAGKEGLGKAPAPLRDGMNNFLKTLGITFRRDPQTGRARANKPGSVMDREQKECGEYYYSG